MALTSLVVCADRNAVQVLGQILRELSIGVEHCADLSAAASRLAAQHFDAVVVDCGGATLMPGLVDGHSHLSFLEKADVVDTGFVPVEEHTLQTMHNARRVLLGGFTSCVGASSATTTRGPRRSYTPPIVAVSNAPAT